jgi:peptide chain release factor 1
MKASLRNKLELLVERAEEVSALLADGSVAANGEQFRKLSKEHAELMPVVEAWSAFRQAEADEAEARLLLKDPDFREMAEDELKASVAHQLRLQTELETLMLPRDPNDSCNIYLEVRAGTGAMRRPFLPATCSACTRALRKNSDGALRWCLPVPVSMGATRK